MAMYFAKKRSKRVGQLTKPRECVSRFQPVDSVPETRSRTSIASLFFVATTQMATALRFGLLGKLCIWASRRCRARHVRCLHSRRMHRERPMTSPTSSGRVDSGLRHQFDLEHVRRARTAGWVLAPTFSNAVIPPRSANARIEQRACSQPPRHNAGSMFASDASGKNPRKK